MQGVQRLTTLAFLLVIVSSPDNTWASRILGLFPTPARSHSRVFESLLRELARRGHEIVFASPFPEQMPHITSKKGSFTPVHLDGGGVLEASMGGVVGPSRDPFTENLILWSIAPALCQHELASPTLQPIIQGALHSNMTFDLIMVEVFFFDCFIPFAHVFKAPLITMTSQWAPPWAHAQVGNPDPVVTSPNMFLPYGDHMSFWQRLHNAGHTAVVMAARHWIYLARQDAVVRKVFGPTTPPLAELERTVSLMFTNCNPMTNFPRSNVPNAIEVGGMHIEPAKSLPKALQEFLDGAKNGVVLISLGSMINSQNLEPRHLTLLTRTFARLPCTVLWKWDATEVPGLPANVRLESWIPQRDVLAHPNIRLLVTHGGLLSTQEAVYEGIPRVILPFFGDQHMNARRAVNTGVALKLNFYTMAEDDLVHAVTSVLTETKYRENARKLAASFRDQPETPLERAVFWTEYVLRHKGAPHLRSAALDLAWYQYFMLDVAAVLLSTLVFSLVLFKMALTAAFKLCSVCTNKEQMKKNA